MCACSVQAPLALDPLRGPLAESRQKAMCRQYLARLDQSLTSAVVKPLC